jgi:septin family protein
MKQLHQVVNLVPVIAKADVFVPEELATFKQLVMATIEEAGIKIFPIPDEHYDLKRVYPFAVMGSNALQEDASGTLRRVREYPWGVVDGKCCFA